nr:lipocalin-like domain-containing protein [Aliivibrio fischeri]
MGEKGYLKKHDFLPIASYEYIEPFIAVRGSVTFDNQTYTITGQGLLEHEWASGFLMKISTAEIGLLLIWIIRLN